MSKGLLTLGAAIGGGVGGWIGSLLDHGNPFGAWGIFLGLVGGVAGIWAAYKLGQSMAD